jgi:hypothetical protein
MILSSSQLKNVFIGISILMIIIQLPLISSLFTFNWDVNTLLFFIPFTTLTLGSLLFKLGSKYGLILLISFSFYAGVIHMLSTIPSISSNFYFGMASYFLVPSSSPPIHFLCAIVFFLLLFFLFKKHIREETKLNETPMYILLFLSFLIVVCARLIQ